MTCGIGATSTGHCHPRIVAAVQEQAATLVHAQQNIFGTHTSQANLIDEMLSITPSGLTSFFFSNSGSEAIDNAIKVARVHTKRPNIVAFTGGFHGRTIGAMSITSSKTSYKAGFQPLMPGCFFSQYPYCLRCDVRAAQERPYQLAPYLSPEVVGAEPQRTCCNSPLNALEGLFEQQTSPQETAAIIVEPIQGEGGIVTPPADFLSVLRDLCDEHGILLIMDEVQSGAGRSGRWWAHEHWDVAADIMVFAKGIASGYQLAGIAARPEIMASPGANTLGGTYGGSAIASAAAVATIQTIRDEDLLANTSQRGEQLCQGLVELSKRYPIVDVRGRGLMIGAELDQEQPAGTAAAISRACRDLNLLVLTAGTGEVLRFLPPLNVSEAEIDQCLSILERGITHALETVDSAAAPISKSRRVGDRVSRASIKRTSSIRDPSINGYNGAK